MVRGGWPTKGVSLHRARCITVVLNPGAQTRSPVLWGLMTDKQPRSAPASVGLVSILLHEPLTVLNYLTVWRRFRHEFNVDPHELESWRKELFRDRGLPSRLAEAWMKKTGSPLQKYTGGATTGPLNEVLYYIVRKLRPETIVETGVAAGFSTSYLLEGLQTNGRGHLYSIDLPNTDPDGRPSSEGWRDRTFVPRAEDTGFVVPEELRARWSLFLGSSQVELPKLLDRIPRVDMFWHDSWHSYENMMWEYQTVWPRIPDGGCLASDDIRWNSAFPNFCENERQRAFTWVGRARGSVLKRPSPSVA